MAKRERNVLQLDISEPLLGLSQSCETMCDRACCGTDAFDVDAKHMIPWIKENGMDAAWLALQQLKAILAQVQAWKGEITSSVEGFNTIWKARKCVEYFEQWCNELVRAMRKVEHKTARGGTK